MTGRPARYLGERYLSEWPGRFRHAELVKAIAAGGPPDAATTADAILAGLITGHDEYQVFERLVRTGEFRIAETMLGECPAFDEARVSQLQELLAEQRADSLQVLTAQLRQLGDRADVAGISLSLNRDLLEARCRENKPAIEPELAAAEQRLEEEIQLKTGKLRARLVAAMPDADAIWTETCAALLKSGYLRTAERMLDDSLDELPGPEGVPRLPPWGWDNEPAQVVLQWHMDPDRPRPRSFAAWQPPDERARDLLSAFDNLLDGGEAAALAFAGALDRFLGADEPQRRPVNRVEGGFLTSLHHVFMDPQTARFHPAGRVQLFVADPGVTTSPAGLQVLGPFVGAGPSVQRSGLAQRGNAAILILEDLLRLVTIRGRRPVSLLRLLGPQWPLSMFMQDSELDRLLGTDERSRWQTLSWLVDLSGLGDLATADAIAFETGLDACLIQVFLEFLDRQSGGRIARDAVSSWHEDMRMSAAAEEAVLKPIRQSAQAEVAFWAALAVSSPGESVSVAELSEAAEIVAGAAEQAPVNWDEEIRSGLAELAPLWLVEAETDTAIRFRSCGVLEVLGGYAEQRLNASCQRLASQLADAEAEARRELSMCRFDARRHALSRSSREYEALAADSDSSPEAREAALKALVEQTAQILEANPAITGECDITQVLRLMETEFRDKYPHLILTTQVPPGAKAAVSSELAQVVLYELLTNAADALADLGGGQVDVTVSPSGQDDLAIHVLDSGAGIDFPRETEHTIFRDGVSTRGEGRGRGLYTARKLVQRADGELTLEARSDSHPVLVGAYFKLILPRP